MSFLYYDMIMWPIGEVVLQGGISMAENKALDPSLLEDPEFEITVLSPCESSGA